MAVSAFAEVTLSEIADFRNGKALSPERYLASGKHPVFGSNGQIACTDELLNLKPVIVIGRVGAYCGSVHYVQKPSWVTDNAIIAEPKAGNDLRYLFYLLGSLELQRTAIGSAQPLMTQSGLKVVRTKAPPLAEQKAIATVLGALDDKIELNQRMNATLEAMARALFQSWFVDFDPFHAKAAGDQPSGIDFATSALFPSDFQDSDLGLIPKGWGVRSLDKVANYLNGLALQKYPPNEDPTLPVIKIAQLRKGDSVGADRCSSSVPSDYIVMDGDVLFSWSGSLEVEIWSGGIGALNQHIFKVTSSEFPKWFYYLWTCQHLENFRLIAASKATTMGHIQRVHLTQAKTLIPPNSLMEAMTCTMAPIIDKIRANRVQSRNLAALRDALLPKLLSGELPAASVAALPLSEQP